MPYITQEARYRLTEKAGWPEPQTPGELAFVIAVLCRDFVDLTGHCYVTYAQVEGVLGTAAREFYRRVTVPYEDQKIQENGDVYDEPPSMQ